MVQVEVVTHPLVAAHVSELRASATANPRFRDLTAHLTRALVFAAAAHLPTRSQEITTPMESTTGTVLEHHPLLVPILRAGLGMLPAALDLLPESPTGFLGLRRNETTLEPTVYMNTLPAIGGGSVFLLDPMLATGGSAQAAAALAAEQGAGPITLISLMAAPEGIEAVNNHGQVDRLVVAAVDRQLNTQGFILPGLGDAGDRQFGQQ